MKKSILNKELWYSFIAMVKYFPKAIVTKQVDGMAFYSTAQQEAFKARVKSLTPNSVRAWGTMNVAQMLHHLNLAVGSALGYFALPDESYWLSRTLYKWILVDFFPEQPIGLRMPLNFVIPLEQVFDFETEKRLLLDILEKAWSTKTDSDWGIHPLLGKMTRKQWGKLVLIHVDYHLKQFSA